MLEDRMAEYAAKQEKGSTAAWKYRLKTCVQIMKSASFVDSLIDQKKPNNLTAFFYFLNTCSLKVWDSTSKL